MTATTVTPPEHRAVRHILSGPTIAARTEPYLSEDDVDWGGLLREAETMSGGEQLLVTIAYDLWHAEGLVGVWELPRRLGDESFRRVVGALELFRAAPDGDESGALRRVA